MNKYTPTLKHIAYLQAGFIVLVLALFAAFIRSHQTNTYIVAPIVGATSSMPGALVSAYPLINPAVTSNLGKHYIIDFKPLELQLKGVQSEYAPQTYVYFVYLNNASWVGANERAMFTAASTVKVPLAMSIMKSVEGGKLSLDQKYTLEQLDLDSRFGDLYKVGADQSFTVQELLKIMLENSDNTAMNALERVLSLVGVQDPFADVYQAMGWQDTVAPVKSPQYNLIDLKTLSDMFISLYNASYISAEHSQIILKYLDDSHFNDQISAGVPGTLPVAHKFGVNALDGTYSDCGIVYAPSRNFLMCLGIKNTDQKTANAFMSEATRAAYQYVIKN